MSSIARYRYYNLALFDGLLNDNLDERTKVIRQINRWVKTCAKECYPQQISDITTKTSPPLPKRFLVSDDAFNNNYNNGDDEEEEEEEEEEDENVNNNINNTEETSIPSPIFTDDSTSVASVSSYNASPNVKEDVPNHNEQQEENVKIKANIIAEGNFKNYNDIIREKQVEEDEDNSIKDPKDMLRLLILTILRMTIDCPFQDVRRSFRKLLDKLKSIGVPIPLPIHPNPSFYIPSEDILTLEWPQTEYYSSATTSIPSFLKSPTSSITSTASSSFDDGYLTRVDPPPNTPIVSTAGVSTNNDSDKEAENNSSFLSSHLITSSIAVKQPDDLTRKLLVTTFMRIGRLSHFYRVLSYFPSFMEKFQRTYNEIVRNTTVLQKEWKFYIGIMAASQHKCQYLVSLLRNEYLTIGGDPKWLESLDNAPRKIRNLSALNTILAHQPWRLKPLDIARLIKGSKDRQDNWAITEIVHVILLLSTFHSMSSYVLGCGIVPEYDSIGGNYEDVSFNNADNVGGGNNDYKAIGLLGNIEDINPDVGAGLGVKLTIEDDSSIHSIKDVDDDIKDDINNSNIGGSNNNDTHTSVKHTTQLIKRLKNKKDLQLSSSSPSSNDTNVNNNKNNNANDSENKSNNKGDNNNDDDGSRLSSTPKLCKFENCDEETFTSDSPNDPLSSSFFANQQPSSSSLSVHGHDFRNNTDSQFPPSLPSVPQLLNQHVEDFSRFADPSVEISYEDFNINSDEYSVFKLQDYCWKDHGALMVNNFLPGLGDLLDDEFQEAKELNDYYSLFQSYTQQNNDLDVAPLRQAIWYYVQRLYGLSKDDYDYSDIRNLLNSKFKMFLKKVCCTPESLTINDWRNVGFQLRSEEKCHVNLIAIESRKQSELIYGLWCVMKCQDGKYDFPEGEWAHISDEAKDLIASLLVKNASERISAEAVLRHPWLRCASDAATLTTPQVIKKNNSARELSQFAESAMAVNRVVQQHFSMNLDYLERPNVYPIDEKAAPYSSTKVFGLSPPSESNLMQRRIKGRSCQFLLPTPAPAIPSPSG